MGYISITIFIFRNVSKMVTIFLFYPHPRICSLFLFYFIFLESRRGRGVGGEKHWSVASYTHPYHGSNLQSRYVCWAGIRPATFCCNGWHSNPLSHPAMADGYHIPKAPAVLWSNWSATVTVRCLVPSARWCFTVNFSPSPMRLVSGSCPPRYAPADSKADSCLNR